MLFCSKERANSRELTNFTTATTETKVHCDGCDTMSPLNISRMQAYEGLGLHTRACKVSKHNVSAFVLSDLGLATSCSMQGSDRPAEDAVLRALLQVQKKKGQLNQARRVGRARFGPAGNCVKQMTHGFWVARLRINLVQRAHGLLAEFLLFDQTYDCSAAIRASIHLDQPSLC